MSVVTIPQYLDVGVVHNLSDLSRLARVLKFGVSNAHLWFRGQSDIDWNLIPKIHRDYDSKAEAELMGSFKSNAHSRHDDLPREDDAAAWLCLMQHQNLPTRLLDWSGSVLIAAYFAVSDEVNDGKPGAIWVTSQGILNFHMTGSSLSGPLQTSHLSGKKVVAVTPPRTDSRMAAQRGAFTLHNEPTPLNRIPEAKIALHRIVIPGQVKAHLRVELSATCGIDEAALFPDTLTSLSNHLQRNVVRNMLRDAAPGFDIHAINLMPVPCWPVDHQITFGKPGKQNNSMIDVDDACTCRTIKCEIVKESPPCTVGDRVLSFDPEAGEEVLVSEGEFEGSRGIVEVWDPVLDVATVAFSFFGQKRHAQFRAKQLKIDKIGKPS